MINAPSTAFIDRINNGDVPFVRMQLTTSRGRVIWIENGDFWADSISFSEAVSADGAFTVGSAVIGQFTFSLTNFDLKYDRVDFAGAVVVPFIYFEIDGAKQLLPKGIFYISSHVTSGHIITCTALDALKLFDNSQTVITYPTTVQSLIQTLCDANGITLATQSIPHGDFVLNEPKDKEQVLTDRQMLSYACECVGCFARMNELGQLAVSWYDFQNPIEITTTFDGKSLWTDPILVTGIQINVGGTGALMAMSIDAYGHLMYMRTSNIDDIFVINENGELVATADDGIQYKIVDGSLMRTGEELVPQESENGNDSVTILYGSDDRVINIDDNPYITVSNVVDVCQTVSDKIFSVSFRPGTLPVLANPCLQAGDVLRVTDNVTGRIYLIPITSTIYSKSIIQNVICAFEDKEDQDLRPSTAYNMRVSVEAAMRQAQQADDIAQAARDLANTSGYQPVISSDVGNDFTEDGNATLLANIYDRDMNLVDPSGTDYIYRWWITQDGTSGRYLDGGKNITIFVDDALCDFTAGIYFETRPISEGIFPFSLCNRAGVILTNRAGAILTARAAERYA